MKNTQTKTITAYQTAAYEGETCGMIAFCKWDGDFMTKPTDSDLDIVAGQTIKQLGLKFESGFDAPPLSLASGSAGERLEHPV